MGKIIEPQGSVYSYILYTCCVLNDNLAQQPQWIKDATGKITGYKTPGGADTVFPFSGDYKITFTLSVKSRQHAGWFSDSGSATVTFSVVNGQVSPATISGSIYSSKITSTDGYTHFWTDYTITNMTVEKL